MWVNRFSDQIRSAVILFVAFIAAFLFHHGSAVGQPERIGVVLMHGARGTANSNAPIGPLITAIREQAILVIAPEMPWSRKRFIDKTVEDTLQEIDSAVASLKSKGATKIIIGGHSIGANAAIAYGARRKGLSGILAIAPGHVPSVDGWQAKMQHDYRRAGQLIVAGKGEQSNEFRIFIQGDAGTVITTPIIYFSWFNPTGSAVYSRNASMLSAQTPLYWIIGEADIMARRGREFAFAHAPENPSSAYVVVSGGHKATPRIGIPEILAWLKSL